MFNWFKKKEAPRSRAIHPDDTEHYEINNIYEELPVTLFKVIQSVDRKSGDIVYELQVRSQTSPYDYKTIGSVDHETQTKTVQHFVRWCNIIYGASSTEGSTNTINGYIYCDKYTNLKKVSEAMGQFMSYLELDAKRHFVSVELDAKEIMEMEK